MSTDKANEQEAPAFIHRRRTTTPRDIVHTANTEDSERGSQAPNGRFLAKDEEDDTEGHVHTAMSSDPDFGAQPPSKRAS